MAVDLDVPARYGIRQSVGDTVGPGGINRSLRNVPVLVGHGRGHGRAVPRRLAAQHHQPDDLPHPGRLPARPASRPSASATRSATGPWTWPSPWASRPRRSRATVAGVNHFPVVTALDVDGRGRVRRPAGDGGRGRRPRRPCPAPGPARGGRDFSPPRLLPAPHPGPPLPRPVGRAARRRRPAPGRVRPVGAHRGVGVGGAFNVELDRHGHPPRAPGRVHRRRRRLAGRHQGAPDLAVGRAPGPGHRLAGDRHAAASCRSTSPTPGRCPTSRTGRWWSRSAWWTGTGSGAGTGRPARRRSPSWSAGTPRSPS